MSSHQSRPWPPWQKFRDKQAAFVLQKCCQAEETLLFPQFCVSRTVTLLALKKQDKMNMGMRETKKQTLRHVLGAHVGNDPRKHNEAVRKQVREERERARKCVNGRVTSMSNGGWASRAPLRNQTEHTSEPQDPRA